jgi:N-acetyl-alpha-D-glucosaminyl L-malate synthase BshA
MNIAILCHATMGGSGIVATELALDLAQLGHEVHIVGERPPFRLNHHQLGSETPEASILYQDLGEEPPALSIWEKFVKISKASANRLLKQSKQPVSKLGRVRFHEIHSCEYPLFDQTSYVTLRVANSLATVCEKYKIDIVHAHYAIPYATSAILARDSGLPIKVVTTLHGTDASLVGMDPAFVHTTRHALKNSDAVTAVSHFLANQAAQNFGIERDSISVIPNWIDGERFYKSTDAKARLDYVQPEELLLVHASNFRRVKRSFDAIRAFEKISQSVSARLLLIGDGPEKQACRELAIELGLIGRVYFIDPTDKIEQFLSIADFLLLTSETEAFSLVAAEAMACESIVIAYNVGALGELINSSDIGILVDSGNIAGIADEVLALARDPERRIKMGIAARARILENYQAAVAIESYASVYRRLLSEQ